MKNMIFCLALVGCLDNGTHRLPEMNPEFVPPGGNPRANATTLVPENLQFALLPINSLRGGITGYDAIADRCVTIVWDYSNNGQSMGRHCDDFFPSFPYVFVSAGACTSDVHYAGNVEMVSASGCVDFADFGAPSTNLVDVTIDVSGPAFTGQIRVRN